MIFASVVLVPGIGVVAYWHRKVHPVRKTVEAHARAVDRAADLDRVHVADEVVALTVGLVLDG